MRTTELTAGEVLDLCAANRIYSKLPYSQIEAEAVWRRLDVAEVIRRHLLARLRKAGIL
jgi:hypothetical protein